jgi:hypothetical protein
LQDGQTALKIDGDRSAWIALARPAKQGREIDDSVGVERRERVVDLRWVGDVSLHERHPMLDFRRNGRWLADIETEHVVPVVDQVAERLRPDKAVTAGDSYAHTSTEAAGNIVVLADQGSEVGVGFSQRRFN